MAAAHAAAVGHDLGWILLAWAIFNTYMLLWSTLANWAVFLVFLTLEATEIILFIGFFGANTNVLKVGGYVGIADRGGRLVHLSGGRGQRHARRRADAAGGQAALGTQADRLIGSSPSDPGGRGLRDHSSALRGPWVA